MKRYILQITSCVLLLGLLSSMISPLTYAASASDTTVQQIIKDINAFRSKHGKGSVTYHQGYADFAQKAAEYTAKNQGSGHARLDGTYWINDFFNQFKPTAAFEDITWGSGANSTLGWIHETGNIDPTHPYGHCESLLYGDPYSVGIGVSSNVVFLDGSAGSMSSTTPEICKILHNATDTDVKNYLYSSNPTLITPKTTQVYTLNAGITEAQFLTDIAARAIDTTAKPLSITSNFSTVVNQAVAGTYTVTLTAKDSLSRTTTKTVNITVRSTPTPLPTPTLTISKTTLSLTKGQSETLIATVTPVSTPVTYTTNNSAVATVTNSGQVTATGLGTTTLTAKISAYGQTVTKTITVTVSAGEFINIPDANLKACINETLKQDAASPITKEQALTLKGLSCDNKGIFSIHGIDSFKNLTYLNLNNNKISNLTSLSTLTTLRTLYISDNIIQDLSPLVSLIYLDGLSVRNNKISDISVLSKCTQLRFISIDNNPIQTITPLKDIITLQTLSFSDTFVSDTSPLLKLTKLSYLTATSTNITNISGIINCKNLDFLSLSNNKISDISPLNQLTSLETLFLNNVGISSIDTLKSLTLLKWLDISHNPIQTIERVSSMPNLKYFFGNSTLISDISPLKNLPLLDTVYLIDAKVSDLDPLTNLQLSTILLQGNQITDFSPIKKIPSTFFNITNQTRFLGTVSQETQLSLREPVTGAPFTIKNIIGGATIDANGTLRFTTVGDHKIEFYSGLQRIGTITATTIDQPIFKDTKLQACINTALNQALEAPITKTQALSLTSLNCSNKGITSLQGLEMFTNLTRLNISHNTITQLSPLSSLTKLTNLNASYNTIESLSPLAFNTLLSTLTLNNNMISNITPLSKLSSLSSLALNSNMISNIQPLTALQLDILLLQNNQIIDFSALKIRPSAFQYSEQLQNLGTIPKATQFILKDAGIGTPFIIKNTGGTSSIDANGVLSFTSVGTHTIEFYSGLQRIGTITATTF